jgi:hypothetical protein
MGIRVMFWLGSADGIATHFLSGPLDRFEAWAIEVESNFPGDIGHENLALIHRVRSVGAAAFEVTDAASAASIDGMLDLYYGWYCDSSERDLLVSADESMLPERYFRAASSVSERPSAREVSHLWRFLLTGRAVLRDPHGWPYTSSDGVFRLGYWTSVECSTLRRILRPTAAGSHRSEADEAIAATFRAVAVAEAKGVGLITTVG